MSKGFLCAVVACLVVFGAAMTVLHYRSMALLDEAQALACVARVV